MDKRDINLLIVTPHFYPTVSGYGRATLGLVEALDKHADGVHFRVICNDSLGGSPEIEMKHGFVTRLRVISWLPQTIAFLIYETRLAFLIAKLDQKEKYDIIFFETLERAWCLFLLTHFSITRKISVRIHGCTETDYFLWGRDFNFRVRLLLSRHVLARLKNIFSTTEYYLDFLRKNFFYNNTLVLAQKNFYIIPLLLPNENSEINVGLDARPLPFSLVSGRFFISVGRLDQQGLDQKGFSDLVQAVFLLNQEGDEELSDYTFVIIGDGDSQAHVRSLVSRLGLSDRFLILSAAANEDIQQLQRHARATIVPSRFEGFCMVTLEALCNGSPIIATCVGSHPRVVREGYNGFLTNPQDVQALAGSIRAILSASPEEIGRLKRNSRDMYKEVCDPQKNARILEGIFRYISEDVK